MAFIEQDTPAQALVFDIRSYNAQAGSDATNAIQGAITSAQNAGGGLVFVPPSASPFLVSSTLQVAADNVGFIGGGWASQLQATAGLGANPMIQVLGPGGAGNFRYGFSIAELFLNGNNVAGVIGLDLISTYGALMDHLRMRFIPGINIHMDGISTAFGAYNYIRHCHITDGGATSTAIQTDNSEWLTVDGGHIGFFSGGTGVGIKLQNLNNVIRGVGFDHNDTSIQMSFCHRNIVNGCQFDRGFTRFIYLQSGANHVISNNFFGVNSGAGTEIIRADGVNNDKSVIVGNTVMAASGWGNFVQEIAGIGGVNTYANNDTGGLPLVLLTGIARGNHGYNPVGHAVAQPAVPATTVAQTNTTGVDCMVFVTGGTVSVVAIGGVATGLTSGAFRVPAGQTITLTYSAAPTWQWFGD